MPGAAFTVADTLELPSVEYATPTAATRTFCRRPDEVPTARRFIREALNGHPASFDAELLTCELVTNAVQHATDAGWVTVAVMHRGTAHSMWMPRSCCWNATRPVREIEDGTCCGGRLSADACHLCLLCHHPG
jgi:hypothetical protein